MQSILVDNVNFHHFESHHPPRWKWVTRWMVPVNGGDFLPLMVSFKGVYHDRGMGYVGYVLSFWAPGPPTVQVWRCRVLSVLIRNTKALQHPAPTLITDDSTWCILISPPWIDWLMIIHNTDNWWSQTWRSSKKPLQAEWIRLIEHDRAKEKRIWTQPGTRH